MELSLRHKNSFWGLKRGWGGRLNNFLAPDGRAFEDTLPDVTAPYLGLTQAGALVLLDIRTYAIRAWSLTMNDIAKAILTESSEVTRLTAVNLADNVAAAAELMVAAYQQGRKVLALGNGGSAADAQHFVAELVGRFALERAALPALALTTNSSVVTSIANDYGYDRVFVRQLEAFGKPGDVLVAISTSGNSHNVLDAMVRARQLGVRTIALTGRRGGSMPGLSDVAVVIPSDCTPRIQEAHITVIHAWCEMIEKRLFGARAE